MGQTVIPDVPFKDDDQIETLLSVRFCNFSDATPELRSSESSPSTSHAELLGEHTSEHGATVQGGQACCRKESEGLVDCMGCLESDSSMFLIGLDPVDADVVNHISMTARHAGAKGVTKEQLLVCTYSVYWQII